MRLAHVLVAVAVPMLMAGIAVAAEPDRGWQWPWLGDELRAGFAAAPVPLYIKGLDTAKVGLGSYFVNTIGGCNDCHTNPAYATGGNPFLGQPKRVNLAKYLAGGMGFGPGVVSRNITPDAADRPAGLTLAQFTHVMRTGEDPLRPGALLQVMPWPVYQGMTDHDLAAIYTYLQAIPSLPNNY